MSGRLAGKVAIVTGAGSSGSQRSNTAAVAVRFAAEGARVIAVDADHASVERTQSLDPTGRIEPVIADVTDGDSIRRVVNTCLDRFDRVDVLCNGAGLGALGGPVETSQDLWQEVLKVNVRSVYLASSAVLPSMIERRCGSIINMSAIAGMAWWGVSCAAYSATKAAVNQLTRLIAVDYARDGIRCNAIIPGFIDGAFAEQELIESVYGGKLEALRSGQARLAPMRRLGRPEEVAKVAVFLASEEATYINGAVLPVDGGLSTQVVSPGAWVVDAAW